MEEITKTIKNKDIKGNTNLKLADISEIKLTIPHRNVTRIEINYTMEPVKNIKELLSFFPNLNNLTIKFNNHEYPGKIKLPQLSDIRIYDGKNVIIKIDSLIELKIFIVEGLTDIISRNYKSSINELLIDCNTDTNVYTKILKNISLNTLRLINYTKEYNIFQYPIENLQTLSVNGKGIFDFDLVNKFKMLIYLFLNGLTLNLKKIKSSSMRTCFFNSCKIEDFDDFLTSPYLSILSFKNCEMVELPDNMELSEITTLIIDNCGINKLPDRFNYSRKLVRLYLPNNLLTELPPSLFNRPHLNIDLDGNPNELYEHPATRDWLTLVGYLGQGNRDNIAIAGGNQNVHDSRVVASLFNSLSKMIFPSRRYYDILSYLLDRDSTTLENKIIISNGIDDIANKIVEKHSLIKDIYFKTLNFEYILDTNDKKLGKKLKSVFEKLSLSEDIKKICKDYLTLFHDNIEDFIKTIPKEEAKTVFQINNNLDDPTEISESKTTLKRMMQLIIYRIELNNPILIHKILKREDYRNGYFITNNTLNEYRVNMRDNFIKYINEGSGYCPLGRFNRLITSMVGYWDDINIVFIIDEEQKFLNYANSLYTKEIEKLGNSRKLEMSAIIHVCSELTKSGVDPTNIHKFLKIYFLDTKKDAEGYMESLDFTHEEIGEALRIMKLI